MRKKFEHKFGGDDKSNRAPKTIEQFIGTRRKRVQINFEVTEDERKRFKILSMKNGMTAKENGQRLIREYLNANS